MLKTTFFEDRHPLARQRLYARRNHFALELIQLAMIPVGEFDERDSLGVPRVDVHWMIALAPLGSPSPPESRVR